MGIGFHISVGSRSQLPRSEVEMGPGPAGAVAPSDENELEAVLVPLNPFESALPDEPYTWRLDRDQHPIPYCRSAPRRDTYKTPKLGVVLKRASGKRASTGNASEGPEDLIASKASTSVVNGLFSATLAAFGRKTPRNPTRSSAA